MKNQFTTLIFRSAAYTLVMLLVYFCLNSILAGNVWAGMEISKSALTVEYCEFNDVQKLFHQRMNTYSNLAYFFFGVFICLLAKEDFKNKAAVAQNRLQQFPLLSFLMGFCFIYLSFGSAFFHASLTWMGQRVDMNGTYSISIVLIFIAIYHVFHKIQFSQSSQKTAIFAILLLILAFYQVHLWISSSILIPIFVLSTWALMVINYIQFRKERSIFIALLSVGCILIAFKIRAMDVQKISCDPYSLYQGHAVWHLLTGLSSFCTYAFFRFTGSK